MFAKYKKIIAVIIIIILAFIAYTLWFSPGSDSEDLLTTSGPAQVEILGQEIIRALNRIDALKLDTSVFNDPVMQKLRDYSEPIQPEEAGRGNPFLPYGTGNSGGIGTTTTQN